MKKNKVITIGLIFFTLVGTLVACSSKQLEPTKIVIEGTYQLESAANMEFIFTKDSKLLVRQTGVYELKTGKESQPILRLSFDDIGFMLPEDYRFLDYEMKKEKESILLNYLPSEEALEAEDMVFYFQEGVDGLLLGIPFNGIYQMGEHKDSYQYQFKEDSTVLFKVNETYYADETMLTLSDHSGTTKYKYEQNETGIQMMNMQEEVIFTLVASE